MAELVQLHIESTIEELEQMERIGLFTRDEIKKVITRRKALEYNLRRRKKNKEDYLKYIQYEVNLLSLIAKRRERFQCDFKRQEIDHTIAKRINKLFKTVTSRFQDDVKMWLSQIEFCRRMKWHHTVSGIYTRMLQVHNSNPALWILGAKWEMEDNNAPENARHLLQRALRHHPVSQHLWLEYFRMELMYSDLLRKRRVALNLQGNKLDDGVSDAILDGGLASIVYRNAVAKITNVSFALSFLTICQQFNFTGRQIAEIFEDVQSRHPNVEETLDAMAKRPLLTIRETLENSKQAGRKQKHVIAEIDEQIYESYELAVKKLSTEKMWSFYIDFCLGRLEATKKTNQRMKFGLKILSLMEAASSENCLSCDHHIEWVRLLSSSDNESIALSTSILAAKKWPTKVSLWHMCLLLHIEAQMPVEDITALFNEAMQSVKEEESLPIWQLGIQWLSLSNPSGLTDFFERGLRMRREVCVPLKYAYLEIAALQDGIQAARDLYRRLVSNPPISPQIYKKMIQIENAQLKPSIDWLRRYYEDAIRQYGESDCDLWLNFMQLEAEHPDGDPSLFAMIYWRAMKFLNGEYLDEFVTRATLYSTGHGLSTEFKLLA